ncbi:MAG: DUF11 domain-containing protein [Luteimonas sp.]|nr:DUF11 domain-containing protein [Luteimonas sp.]
MSKANWMLTLVALLLLAALQPAHAQQCTFGTYRPFAAINGQSPSQTAVNNNNVYVGSSRLQVSHQTFGSGSINTNDISQSHYTGEPGIRIGHSGNANSYNNRIETTLNFRDPQNMAQFLPVTNLTFRLHDVDAGDNVTVDAYDQNGMLIPLTTAIYSFDGSSGSPYVSYAGGNRFTSSSNDASSNGRRGTVNLNFAGYQVRLIVFRYYDVNSNGTYTIAEMFGCNVPITLFKTTNGSAGGSFGFTLTNTTRNTGATVTTTAAGTPTQVDGNTSAGMQPFTVSTPGTAVTINESSLPSGWSLVGATCTDAGGAVVGSRSGNVYTLPALATRSGQALTCTFTNSRTNLRLQKALPNGRVLAGDQFALSIAGPGAPAAVTTTGSGTTAAGMVTHTTATAGSVYTLSEAAVGTTVLANYATTWSCTNTRPGGQTPSGSGTSFSVTPVAGDDLTCTFTNALTLVDLRITKTNTPAAGPNDQVNDVLLSGSQTTYTIVVRNNGPSAVANAIVRDTPTAGLSACALASPACEVTDGTATCPVVGTGAGQLSIANLQNTGAGGGVWVPGMDNGGEVTFRITCTVN